MNKNITVKGGNCNHLRYVAKLLEIVRSVTIKPEHILTKHEAFTVVMKLIDISTPETPDGSSSSCGRRIADGCEAREQPNY